MIRKNKKLVEGDQTNEWRKSGSFVNKPQRGWLHPDSAVMGPGVVYSVQYLGCIEVRQSMRTLEFDMRTQATKEAIWRVLAATGYSPLPLPATKGGRKKPPKDIAKILGDRPNLQFSLAFINLTISTASLTLVVSNTGQFIANHQMQSISFASGGDPDTIDYVAYVAKDPINNRACHVLRCADGLAQDVINTVGQAFELRFKEYLKNPPKAVTPPDRTEPLFHDGKSRWGDDEPEYYNEMPGKQAPEAASAGGAKRADDVTAAHKPEEANVVKQPVKNQDYVNNGIQAGDVGNHLAGNLLMNKQQQQVPRSQLRSGKSFEDHNYVNTTPIAETAAAVTHPNPALKQNPLNHHQAKGDGGRNLIELATPPATPNKQTPHMMGGSSGVGGALAIAAAMGGMTSPVVSSPQPRVMGGATSSVTSSPQPRSDVNSRPSVDAFDMRPFSNTPPVQHPPGSQSAASKRLALEAWFHSHITRKEAEGLLSRDGDFLVRESSSTQGQFVLSGVKDGLYKHLLLVDPSGVVRTKDRHFDSVSHLISFHRDNNLPIVSSGSVLLLRQPVNRVER